MASEYLSKKVESLGLEPVIANVLPFVGDASFGVFYSFPNQNVDYLVESFGLMKDLCEENKKVKNALFIGGTLYSGIIKGMNRGINVDVVEFDSRAIISQLYSVYCIQNNGTKNSTLNHLLLDGFANSLFVKNPVVYSSKRVKKEMDYFRGFAGEKISDEDCEKLFLALFRLKTAGNSYYKSLPSLDSNPSIIPEIFDKGIRPDFPDNAYLGNALDFDSCKKYDLIMSNNVFELTDSPVFFKKMSRLLNDNGLLEITSLKNAVLSQSHYFERCANVLTSGKALGVYNIFLNANNNFLKISADLRKRVEILKKK
ncbi:MAG: hypothetical protein PHT91_03325 [Candidatus Nanoarchaeia archaeon]|nr:hypothetical protein [Candidatus Nanoarchaeia archaeon]